MLKTQPLLKEVCFYLMNEIDSQVMKGKLRKKEFCKKRE